MRFLCRNWYKLGVVVAIGMIIFTAFTWNQSDALQRMMNCSFIAMLLHQAEEYWFPGGEPAIMNIVLRGSDIPDRYPLNQLSAMLSNVLIAYIWYLLPVFLPHVIWLDFAPIVMGMLQFIVHGVITNRKMHTLYNPGLGAVVLLHLPIGVCFFYYIISNGLLTGLDLILGIIYTIFGLAFVLVFLTYKVLPNRDTTYVFGQDEMNRFHIK